MRGPGATLVVLALALLSEPRARAEEPTGFVQFKADAGVRIEIEGRLVGYTTGRDGLIARGIRPGARRWAAHREGFVSQHGMVLVEADEVAIKRLDAWQPVMNAAVEHTQGSGTLIIETLPVDATILARRLGWKDKVAKGEGPFIARELPAGSHKFTFCTEFKCIDYWVKVPSAGVQKLLIDFEPGHIYDLSREFLSDWRSAAKRCDPKADRDACKLACETDAFLHPDDPSPACNALNGPDTTGMVVQEQGNAIKAAASFVAPVACDIESGSAFISVMSQEAVEVLLGEDPIGRTPIVHQSIPAGCHQLVAVTGDGKRHRISIRVQPNEDRRIKLTY